MIDELADLLLGARCPGCGAAGLGVCTGCRARLGGPVRRVVDAPGLGHLVVLSSGRYEGPLRELLNAHKDRSALSLTGLLGGLLAPGVALLARGAPAGRRVVLVPVPSSPAAVRERGFDHCRALARATARRLAGPGPEVRVRAVLRRRARVTDQSALGRGARARNQQGSMVARPPAPGEVAVLVDDICTTGASLAEAARALRAAGWTVLGAAVLAHPERHH